MRNLHGTGAIHEKYLPAKWFAHAMLLVWQLQGTSCIALLVNQDSQKRLINKCTSEAEDLRVRLVTKSAQGQF